MKRLKKSAPKPPPVVLKQGWAVPGGAKNRHFFRSLDPEAEMMPSECSRYRIGTRAQLESGATGSKPNCSYCAPVARKYLR